MREGQAYHSVVVVLYLNAEIRENQIASGCPRNDFLGFLDIVVSPKFWLFTRKLDLFNSHGIFRQPSSSACEAAFSMGT
jgi:hypothetical protein